MVIQNDRDHLVPDLGGSDLSGLFSAAGVAADDTSATAVFRVVAVGVENDADAVDVIVVIVGDVVRKVKLS